MSVEQDLDDYLQILRTKWFEVPFGKNRVSTKDLRELGNGELVSTWNNARLEATTKTRSYDGFAARGWYHVLYKPVLKGKKVLDVGSGAGFDGVTFAENEARVTFLDILEPNLLIVRKICELLNVDNVNFLYLEKESCLESLPNDFDFIWCQGSLINAPKEIIRQEVQLLLKHLKDDGRWIELAYPKRRWERQGKKKFDHWGKITEGGAPWIEWYDLDKLLSVLAPSKFVPILYFDYCDSEFNWFDLLRVKQ